MDYIKKNEASQEAPAPTFHTFTSPDNESGLLVVRNTTYKWDAPRRGSQGISVQEIVKDKEGRETITHHLLPPIAGRYDKGEGVIYLVPSANGDQYYHLTAEEIEKGAISQKRGDRDERNSMRRKELQDIWFKVAQTWQLVPPSPTVYEGFPLTAPECLKPLHGTAEDAKACWAELGVRLSPRGRWIIGSVLTSPWLIKAGGMSCIIHLVGEGKGGKSLFASAAASLFGPAELTSEGLFNPFDSSDQGVSTYAQSLAYYPVILDEIQAFTGSPTVILTRLINGAKRKRSGRNGSPVVNKSSWYGLVLTTGNQLLSDLGITHEQYDRRLLNIQAPDLWNTVVMPQELKALDDWWEETFDLILEAEGWVWQEFCTSYMPGTPAAKRLIELLKTRNEDGSFIIPKPGSDALGRLGQLGMFGCMWLSEWTGETAWVADVFESAQDLILKRQAEKKDVAREAAEAIIEDMGENARAWTWTGALGDEYNNNRGFPSSGTSAQHSCGIAHEEGCKWYDCLKSTFKELVTVDETRLFANEKFRQAIYTPNEASVWRKIKVKDRRLWALTFCQYAFVELASPLPQEARDEKILSEKTIEPTFDVMNSRTQEEKTMRKLTSSNVENDPSQVAEVLNKAADEGYTDVVGRHDWYLPATPGWKTKSQGNTFSCTMTRESDEKKIRVSLALHGQITPEEQMHALEVILAREPKFYTPSMLGTQFLKKPTRGSTPRWQLEDAQADLWKPEVVLHPTQWGKTASERKTMELAQYDRNKSHLPAIANAMVAPLLKGEVWTHFASDAPIDRKWAGMYLLEVPDWTGRFLPSPCGTAAAGSVKWTTNEVVKLLVELGHTPVIREAWLAPAHKVAALQHTAENFKTLLQDFENEPVAREMVKLGYQQFAGMIDSEQYSRGKWNAVYRPDWAQAIRDNSYCNTLRTVYKVYQEDSRFIPESVNVDAVYYPKGLPLPPAMKIGDGLGMFKVVES